MRTGGAPSETATAMPAGPSSPVERPPRRTSWPSARTTPTRMTRTPTTPRDRPDATDASGFAAANGWDRDYETYSDFDLPTYVGPTTFMNLPWVTDPAELHARAVDVAIVGAPFDDAVSHRPGARFGPRAIREAQYTSGSINSLQLGVEPFEILTGRRRRRREHRPGLDRARPRPHLPQGPRGRGHRRDPDRPRRRPLDHLAVGDRGRRGPPAGHASASSTSTPTPTPRTTTGASSPGHGTPMRRLIESGAVDGRNFVQVGLRGYWPPVDVFEWMQEHGLRYHFMTEIEERGADAVIDDAIAEALDGPDAIYLSVDIDVVDPGSRRAPGTPEPGGLLTRELLRAIRRIVGAVELAGMDIVEVSPPYDHAETTAMIANRAALEAISALAVKKAAGPARPLRPGALSDDGRPPPAPPTPVADALARLYDVDLVEDPGDLDLYLALAARAEGPVLELAAGTGRLAVPLAEAGHDVTAVDLDPAMLARLRRRTRAAGGRRPAGRSRRSSRRTCSTSTTRRPARTRLAFIALNSLFLLATRDGQRAGVPDDGASTSRRAASPSSTSGCPTPTTSPASTAG